MKKLKIAGVKITVHAVENEGDFEFMVSAFRKIESDNFIHTTVVAENSITFYTELEIHCISERTPEEFFGVTKSLAIMFVNNHALEVGTRNRAIVVKLAQKWYNRHIAELLRSSGLMDETVALKLTSPHYSVDKI